MNIIGMLYPRVTSRKAKGKSLPDYHELHDWLLEQFLGRWPELDKWTCLCHKIAGWQGSMAGGDYQKLPLEWREAYRDAIGEAMAKRPGFEAHVYIGSQFVTPYTIHGDPEKRNTMTWADPDNPAHVRGIIDLTVQPLVDMGFRGVVFDSGSRNPHLISGWRRRLCDIGVNTVGLESLVMDGDSIYWWYAKRGMQYHALSRYRNGKPFLESVPDAARGKAHVWIRQNPIPSADEIRGMHERGWVICPDDRRDELVREALL